MRYALAALFALLVVGVASGGPDDQATPARRLPVAPAPAECPSARALEDARSGPDVEPFDVRAEAAAVLLDLAACMNTGELRRVMPLFTDEAPQETIAALGPKPASWSPQRAPESLLPPGSNARRMAIVWVGELWPMPDGRLAVPAIMRRGALAETRSLLILDRRDARLRIDAIVAIDPGSEPPAATTPGGAEARPVSRMP